MSNFCFAHSSFRNISKKILIFVFVKVTNKQYETKKLGQLCGYQITQALSLFKTRYCITSSEKELQLIEKTRCFRAYDKFESYSCEVITFDLEL